MQQLTRRGTGWNKPPACCCFSWFLHIGYMKTCFKCGLSKPLFDFYKHKAMADGHLNKCKTCTKDDAHKHRHGAGRERVLAYETARSKTPERRANASKTIAAWKAQNPIRRDAQVKLGNAVRNGTVMRWPVCALPECNKKPEAHHPDYSRPLDVVWLCSSHHKQAHALVRDDDHS